MYIHFAVNQNFTLGNKEAKVLPLHSLFNSSIVKFGKFHEDLSINESNIPYLGMHRAKKFIRGKTIRF